MMAFCHDWMRCRARRFDYPTGAWHHISGQEKQPDVLGEGLEHGENAACCFYIHKTGFT
jgi:hypothetical protein